VKPSEKELKVIKLTERLYNRKYRNGILFFLKPNFKFKNISVSDNKNMEVLWSKYGLKNFNNFKFTESEKIDCMQQWYNILFITDFDLMSDFKIKKDKFSADARKTIKENPGVHFNWILMTPEYYLKTKSPEFGEYS
jgi:hypothetical protein